MKTSEVKIQTLASSLKKKENTEKVQETSPFKKQEWGTDITTLIFEKCDALQLLLLERVSKTANRFLNERCRQLKHCRMVEDLLGPSSVDIGHSDGKQIESLKQQLIEKNHIYSGDINSISETKKIPSPLNQLAVRARLLFEYRSLSHIITKYASKDGLKNHLPSAAENHINTIRKIRNLLTSQETPVLLLNDSQFSVPKKAIINCFLLNNLGDNVEFNLYRYSYRYRGKLSHDGYFTNGTLTMFFGLKRFEYTGYFGYVSKTKKNTFFNGQGTFKSLHDSSHNYSGTWNNGTLILDSTEITIEIKANNDYFPEIKIKTL